MLFYLFYHELQRHFHALNVFRYITVRTALASITALLLALVLGPWVIRQLREMQIGQFIREEGPKSHQSKAGTPTMGGVLIVCSTVIPTLLWGDLENEYIWLAVFTMLLFGAIGFIDDYSKVANRRNMGLSGKGKFSLQVLASLGVAVTLVMLTAAGMYSTQLSVPFLKNFHPELVIHSLVRHPYLWTVAYLPFLVFVVSVIVGSSNAVNLTDGLDGLAIGCVVVAWSLGGLRARISLVQRASRRSVHGRRRIARARRVHRNGGGGHQAGNPFVFCGRRVRAGSAFGDSAGGLFPPHRQAHLPHVPATSSFRAGWMERIENYRAVLDRGAGLCSVFADHVETEVKS